MFYYLDKVDYDGKNLKILDESIMDDPNLPHAKTLAKLGMISRLWAFTCTQLEPDADEMRAEHINENLFNNNENNATILKVILHLIFNQNLNNAQEILDNLSNNQIIQSNPVLMKKASFFLDSLENFGGLNLGIAMEDDAPTM